MPKVEKMFAFVMANPTPEHESVVAVETQKGKFEPFVGFDLKRIEELRPMAQEIARATGRSVELLEFTNRRTVETIKP